MRKTQKLNNQGFAAIVIAITLVIVLSLITVGFARLMRNEQRSALDSHLSHQAYLAAETGINDAVRAVRAGFSETKSDCAPYSSTASATGAKRYLANSQVAAAGEGVSYPCLLVNPTPLDLMYNPLAPNQTVSTKMTGVANGNGAPLITRIEISWRPIDSGTSGNFNTNAGEFGHMKHDWPFGAGVIKASLTPLRQSCMTRDCLTQHNYTVFGYPSTQGGGGGRSSELNVAGAGMYNPSRWEQDQEVTLDSGNLAAVLNSNGALLSGNCDQGGSGQCRITISNLPKSYNYLLTLQSLYQRANVTVSAYNSEGTRLKIADAQVVIDSTGKAQDVLRRVQVRMPAANSYAVPDAALQVVGGICKQLWLTGESASSDTNRCEQ